MKKCNVKKCTKSQKKNPIAATHPTAFSTPSTPARKPHYPRKDKRVTNEKSAIRVFGYETGTRNSRSTNLSRHNSCWLSRPPPHTHTWPTKTPQMTSARLFMGGRGRGGGPSEIKTKIHNRRILQHFPPQWSLAPSTAWHLTNIKATNDLRKPFFGGIRAKL